jgi:hypothetical protein
MGKFIVEYPHLSADFVSTVDGEGFLDDLNSNSSTMCVWKCGEHDHTYEATVRRRAEGATCPYCSGRKILKGFNDVATTHPQVLEEWNDATYKPTELSAGSNKIVEWKCENGHNRKMSVKDKLKGSRCGQCLKQETPKQGKEMKAATKTTTVDNEIQDAYDNAVVYRPTYNDLHVLDEFRNWVETTYAGHYETPATMYLGKKFDYMFPHNGLIILIHPVFHTKLAGIRTRNYLQEKHEWFAHLGYTILPLWEDEIIAHSDKVKQAVINHANAGKPEPVKVKLWNNNGIKEFHRTHSYQTFVEAERHYVVNSLQGEPVAVMSTNVQDSEDKKYFIAEIENFTVVNNPTAYLTEMLSYVSSLWGNSVEYHITVPYHQKHIWESNGFQVEKETPQKWRISGDTGEREMGHDSGIYSENMYTMVKPAVLL